MISVDAEKGRELIKAKMAEWGSREKQQLREKDLQCKAQKKDLRELAKRLGLGKTALERKR